MFQEFIRPFKEADKEDYILAGYIMLVGVGISCIIFATGILLAYIYGGL